MSTLTTHPIVDAIIEQMGALVDGRLPTSAVNALQAELLGHEHAALAEALHQTLLFAAFLDGEGGRSVSLQLLEIVERHAQRLPFDDRPSLQAAVLLGKERQLTPVGASPTPPGAVRGGLAARLSTLSPPKR